MKTEVIRLNSLGSRQKQRSLEQAAAILMAGGIIVFPTETSYGLGADATNRKAVAKIFALKGRPAGKPIPVICSSISMAQKYAEVSKAAEKLARKFMPGPLTLIVEKKKGALPGLLSASGIAFRIPGSETALAICRKLGRPVTATSANKSGEPSAYSESEVLEKFFGRVDAIFLQGDLPRKPPSTIVDLRESPPGLVRPGPIEFFRISAELNKQAK